MNLSSFEGKEVFVAIEGEDESVGFMYVTENWDGLVEHLKTYDSMLNPEIRVYNGVLANAAYIPGNMRKCNVFIIVQDPTSPEKAACSELPEGSSEDIAEAIEEEIECALGGVATDIIFNNEIEIEHMFLLYGKQLSTFICADDGGLDEEMIHRAQKVYNDIKELKSLEKIKNA